MSIPRMNYPQYRKARKLTHECCNYCDGNCLLLDDKILPHPEARHIADYERNGISRLDALA